MFLHKVSISTIKPSISKKKVQISESNVTYLVCFIVVAVKVSSILIGCVRGPLRPIGDDAGPGELESGKSRDPLGSLLY